MINVAAPFDENDNFSDSWNWLQDVGDESQRSSISSGSGQSGQSVATQCTTAINVGGKLTIKTTQNVDNVDDDEDDGLILKPLLLSVEDFDEMAPKFNPA
jgi:hypothetical protein